MKIKGHHIHTALLVIAVLVGEKANAQSISLDKSFSDDGIVTTNFHVDGWYHSLDKSNVITLLDDGRILSAGLSGMQKTHFALACYKSNGDLDSSFGKDGKAETEVSMDYNWADAIAVQNDAKIVLAGFSVNDTGVYEFALVRYLKNGILDSAFGSKGIVKTIFGAYTGQNITSVAIQPDGKIVASGMVDKGNGYHDFALARYNTDGSIDSSFGDEGKVITGFAPYNDDISNKMVIQSDGKIILAGSTYGSDSLGFAMIRYNTDGSLDKNFGDTGKVITSIGKWGVIHALTLDSKGKILAAGQVTFGEYPDFAVLRYNTDGSLDTSFGTGGLFTINFSTQEDVATAIGLQKDGMIVAAGYMTDLKKGNNVALTRIDQDGQPDYMFGSDAMVELSIPKLSFLSDMVIQTDGKFVITGQYYDQDMDFCLARLQDSKSGIAEETEANRAVSLYPNPVNSFVTVRVSDPQFSKGDLCIYNALGQKVQSQMLSGCNERLPVNLAPGVYCYKLSDNKRLIGEGKIIVEK